MAEALPDGWAEHSDAASGNKFYHNAVTGETSWERPKPVAAAAAAAAGGALAEGWTEHPDPASGRSFYYKAATGETSWEKPQSIASTEKKDTTWSTVQARVLGKELNLDVLRGKVDILDKETHKSVSKTVFALNTGSITASLGLVALFSQSQDEYWMLWRADKEADADKIFEELENPPSKALPDGWAEHIDPPSGKSFYYNSATGQTSWEKPQSADKTASALPDGWTEHRDEASGRSFYYNAAKGETSWERPQPAAGAQAKGALAEGWAEHVDPTSGKTFYYKAATGETSWEKPCVEDARSLDLSRGGVELESSDARASRRTELRKKSAWS